MGKKPTRCEKCKQPVKRAKRFCRQCAVEIAKQWDLDYFEPDQHDEDTKLDNPPVSYEDPVYAYERENRIKAYCALGILALIGTLAIVAVVGGL